VSVVFADSHRNPIRPLPLRPPFSAGVPLFHVVVFFPNRLRFLRPTERSNAVCTLTTFEVEIPVSLIPPFLSGRDVGYPPTWPLPTLSSTYARTPTTALRHKITPHFVEPVFFFDPLFPPGFLPRFLPFFRYRPDLGAPRP